MKTNYYFIIFLSIGLMHLSAQTGVKISDISCYNLGDGRYYCQYDETKKPLEGRTRIIDGYTSQYTEAVFSKGIPNGSWKRYKNNVLEVEYAYKEGIMHGAYKEYYVDGSVKASRNYVNGKPEGKFLQYSPAGKIESEVNYKNGVQDGAEIHYNNDGSIRSSITFAAGKETGATKRLISSNTGDYEITASYKNGKYDGAYSEIFTNGNVKTTGYYIEGNKDGTWESGKRDGGKIRTEVYANGDKIKETLYFSDGSVDVVRELKNGKKNGWERTYNYSDGTLKSELYYNDGAISSNVANGGGGAGNSGGMVKQTKQMSSGSGAYIQTFYQNNGKYEGEYTEQWVEGKKAMKTIGQYENGKKTGLWVYRDKFDYKIQEESYVNDKLDGKQIHYDDGEVIGKYYTYKNNEREGEYAQYSYGKINTKGTYVNGRIGGLRTTYYPNGNIREENYTPQNPSEDRWIKQYAEDGVIRREFFDKNGRRVEEKQYHPNGKIHRINRLDENGRMSLAEEYDINGKRTK